MQLSPPNGRHAEEIARRAHARALDAAHKLILKRVLCTMLLLDAAKEARFLPSDRYLYPCPPTREPFYPYPSTPLPLPLPLVRRASCRATRASSARPPTSSRPP